MINLTNVFLNTAPSRFKLSFGVNKNVLLKKVSNEIKRDKNGVKINKCCYLSFVAVDTTDNNKPLAETTFSYFNIDKPAYATKSFIHQYIQLIEILMAVVPKDNKKAATKVLYAGLSKDKELLAKISTTEVADNKTSKVIGELQTRLTDSFIQAVTPYLGAEGDLVNLAVVCDSKGQFLDLPREDKGFISKVDSGKPVTIDAKYIRWHENKNKPEIAKKDDLGADDVLVAEDAMVLDEEQELDL